MVVEAEVEVQQGLLKHINSLNTITRVELSVVSSISACYLTNCSNLSVLRWQVVMYSVVALSLLLLVAAHSTWLSAIWPRV